MENGQTEFHMEKASCFTLMGLTMWATLIKETQMEKEDSSAPKDGFMREIYKMSRQKEKEFYTTKD